jgi:TonB family protein
MKQNQSFKKFMITSLVVHISLFAALLLFSKLNPPAEKKETIEISFLDEAQVKVKTKDIQINKIVETDSQMANQQISEKAKYLSEKNNTVEKETRAKTGEKFQNTKMKTAAQKMQKAEKAQKNTPRLFEQGFNAYSALTKKQMNEQKAQSGQAAVDSSTTNDSLPDVNETLITRLNTREYKYYSYYTRIKKQLNQWWVPKVKQKFTKMFKQGRTIASEESKITKLTIVLNTSGVLVGVQVMAESGVRDLDDAAIEAFRSAAPFPNPPKGMIETDGTVKIRWDCVVES